MYTLVEKMREKLRSEGLLLEDGNMSGEVKTVVGFGHMGDGNLHLNIVGKEYNEKVKSVIEPFVYEIVGEFKDPSHPAEVGTREGAKQEWGSCEGIELIVAEKGGSISAEHGLGVMKAPYISYSQSKTSIDMMRRIKQMFDPKGLLNPYKYILTEETHAKDGQ